MGVYDTMWITCPYCGKQTSEQTKSLDSCLRDIDYDKPVNYYEAVSAAGYWDCELCGKAFKVEGLPEPKKVTLKPEKLNAEELRLKN